MSSGPGQLPALPNLSSRQVVAVTLPPDPATYVIPDAVRRGGKSAYRAWCADTKTAHAFISVFFGAAPAERVSKTNPATVAHGVLVDYDAAPPEDVLGLVRANSAAGGSLLPTWALRSFSGHARLLWLFDDPLAIPSADWWRHFVRVFLRAANAAALLPGCQSSEAEDVAHYYEVGVGWESLGQPIASSEIAVIAFDATRQWASSHKSEDVSLPWSDIEARVREMWPGAWTGPFEVGRRGPAFWVPGSTNPNCAVVLERGMYAFTTSAATPFVTWRDLLGAQWWDARTRSSLARVVGGNYVYDRGTRTYWRRDADGVWAQVALESLRRDLQVIHGLSTKKPEGAKASQVDQAIVAIEHQAAVDAVVPLIYRPAGVMTWEGGRVLNTSRKQPVAPASRCDGWGDGFPFLARWMDAMLGPEQTDHLLYWLWWAYSNAHKGTPQRGHSVFFCGPPGTGKTWFATRVIGGLMGGHYVAERILLGEESFNGSAFRFGVWTCDDAEIRSDRAAEALEQIIKQMTANDSVYARAMYREGQTVHWPGRIVVSCNDDPESLRLLPAGERGSGDKFSFFRVAGNSAALGPWLDDDATAAELPALGAYLLQFCQVPPSLSDHRWGVRNYHHPELVAAVKAATPTTDFAELVVAFRGHLADHGEPCWEGTPTELLRVWSQLESFKIFADRVRSANSLGRSLSKLVLRGESGIAKTSTTSRTYRIMAAEREAQ